ncbi:4a-hydroxytetrahydrobiopterin dehydratase [Actinorhabdospora filicis]|uniref:Putative pterin-4-alpha-carbinolamine dehydratase n=1 Tax=Actinorhabdospora filicis TaxID=1785913 RepID=A0A9W6SUT4_9ACTN|nr:4a-hydroxytetrahydrobiopterin dehydratase [Actinorhabdospora filicis]GLZ81146.1 4a-hydroxytetrahydrobiopterin dehydratase [Actinorhabdospora filicis]
MSGILAPEELTEALKRLPGWSGDGEGIERTAELPGFATAIAVVDRVAAIAEQLDHHPDIDIRWRTLTFRCSTHSAGGVTARDLDLAARIEEVLAGVS